MPELLLDAAGRRRSPATLPRNKGLRYPADPPTVEEIVTVMRRAGDGVHGRRLRGRIVVLWRAGLRICEVIVSAIERGSGSGRAGTRLLGHRILRDPVARSHWPTLLRRRGGTPRRSAGVSHGVPDFEPVTRALAGQPDRGDVVEVGRDRPPPAAVVEPERGHGHSSSPLTPTPARW